MNIIGPHYLIGNVTTRSWEFAEVGMVSLEEICYFGEGSDVSYHQDATQCVSQLPVDSKIYIYI